MWFCFPLYFSVYFTTDICLHKVKLPHLKIFPPRKQEGESVLVDILRDRTAGLGLGGSYVILFSSCTADIYKRKMMTLTGNMPTLALSHSFRTTGPAQRI